MKYIILDRDSKGELVKDVNDYISFGYIPQGGISISRDNEGYPGHIYAQAMTKINP